MDSSLSIILLGKAGVGKSASANTILRQPVFESRKAFGQVTKLISVGTRTVNEKNVAVFDTPDILKSEDQLKRFIQCVLQESSSSIFLLVIKVGRFTAENMKAVETAEKILGPQRMKNCFLLFTGGDSLSKPLDEYLLDPSSKSKLTDVVKKFPERYYLFNNKDEGQEQIEQLLLKLEHIKTPACHPGNASESNISSESVSQPLDTPVGGKKDDTVISCGHEATVQGTTETNKQTQSKQDLDVQDLQAPEKMQTKETKVNLEIFLEDLGLKQHYREKLSLSKILEINEKTITDEPVKSRIGSKNVHVSVLCAPAASQL
uniref:Interferon-induced very large GTPase 1-like n=1 Tax=Kryptolebias marmoratus TaxID=37003 RepID=A0A3Q3BD16_KRYMA